MGNNAVASGEQQKGTGGYACVGVCVCVCVCQCVQTHTAYEIYTGWLGKAFLIKGHFSKVLKEARDQALWMDIS